MSIPIVQVTATLYELHGVPMVGARLTARLTAPIIFEGVVVPQLEGATTDLDGRCVLNLVPTSLGQAATTYSFEVWPAYAPEPTVFEGIAVPNVAAITLEELLGGVPAGGGTLIYWAGPDHWSGELYFGQYTAPSSLGYWSGPTYFSGGLFWA